jgi:hypothetical protein
MFCFDFLIGLSIATFGIWVIKRARFTLATINPKMQLTRARAQVFGMICLVSAALMVLYWASNDFYNIDPSESSVIYIVVTATPVVGFLILLFFELILSPFDDVLTYDGAIARKRKRRISSSFLDTGDASDEGKLNSARPIRLGDDGELIYEKEQSEKTSSEQH